MLNIKRKIIKIFRFQFINKNSLDIICTLYILECKIFVFIFVYLYYVKKYWISLLKLNLSSRIIQYSYIRYYYLWIFQLYFYCFLLEKLLNCGDFQFSQICLSILFAASMAISNSSKSSNSSNSSNRFGRTTRLPPTVQCQMFHRPSPSFILRPIVTVPAHGDEFLNENCCYWKFLICVCVWECECARVCVCAWVLFIFHVAGAVVLSSLFSPAPCAFCVIFAGWNGTFGKLISFLDADTRHTHSHIQIYTTALFLTQS